MTLDVILINQIYSYFTIPNLLIILFYGIIIPILILRDSEYKEKHKNFAYILIILTVLGNLRILTSFGPQFNIFILSGYAKLILFFFFFKLIKILLKSEEKIERYLTFPLIIYLIEKTIFFILGIIASSGNLF